MSCDREDHRSEESGSNRDLDQWARGLDDGQRENADDGEEQPLEVINGPFVILQ